MVLRVAAGPKTKVALLELLVADQDLGDNRRRMLGERLVWRGQAAELLRDQVAYSGVLEVADGRNDQVARRVGVDEVLAETIRVERLDRFARPENGPPERMVLPEALGEQLVDQIVGRILDHLDLFDDHFLLALDVVRG